MITNKTINEKSFFERLVIKAETKFNIKNQEQKMKITTNVFLSESDVRKIVKQHLENEGYKQIGDIEINVRSKKDIPEGATAGDCIGINAKVESC